MRFGVDEILEENPEKYHGEDAFARVIQGFDFDGDGKVDLMEVLE